MNENETNKYARLSEIVSMVKRYKENVCHSWAKGQHGGMCSVDKCRWYQNPFNTDNYTEYIANNNVRVIVPLMEMEKMIPGMAHDEEFIEEICWASWASREMHGDEPPPRFKMIKEIYHQLQNMGDT